LKDPSGVAGRGRAGKVTKVGQRRGPSSIGGFELSRGYEGGEVGRYGGGWVAFGMSLSISRAVTDSPGSSARCRYSHVREALSLAPPRGNTDGLCVRGVCALPHSVSFPALSVYICIENRSYTQFKTQ